MNDYDFGYGKQNRNIFQHAGFRLGFAGGVIMVVVHLALLLIFRGTNGGDLLGWFLAWFVYFMVGRMAAQAHYNSQLDDINPMNGVAGAGAGAALVASIMIWLFIIVRGIFRDAVGIYVIVEPIGLFCAILVDVLIALAIGRWAGKMVANKYRVFENY